MIPLAVLIVTLISLSCSHGFEMPSEPLTILLEINDGEEENDNKLPFLLAIGAILLGETKNQASTNDSNVRTAVSSTNSAMLATNMMGMMMPSMSAMMLPLSMMTVVISLAAVIIENTMTPAPVSVPTTTPVPAPTCPTNDNWMLIGNSCYLFKLEDSDMVTWQEARAICMMAGGKLAELETDTENTMVKDKVMELLNGIALGGVWIGGQDMNSDDVWVWDSTGQNIVSTDWDAGNSFATSNINPPLAKCMMIFLSQGFRWRNDPCTDQQRYICEITLAV